MKEFNYVDTDSIKVEENPYVAEMKREGTGASAFFTKGGSDYVFFEGTYITREEYNRWYEEMYGEEA